MQHLKKFLKGTYLSIFNILLATVVVLNCKGTYRIANKIFHIDKNIEFFKWNSLRTSKLLDFFTSLKSDNI